MQRDVLKMSGEVLISIVTEKMRIIFEIYTLMNAKVKE